MSLIVGDSSLAGCRQRGEATARSDLDVLVVRPETIEPDEAIWQNQLSDLADRVRGWTGRLVPHHRHEPK